jgi:trimethylamine--corrinoid protein Co-methyltransferase
VLPNLDMIGFPLEPQDIPASARYVRPVTCALAESDKPLEYALSTAEHVRVLVDTSEIVFGSAWDERPRAFSVLNTISPLQYEEGTCVAILEMAGRNQPICITPCAMGGTTGPATVAGVLVQQHAETLAGLVLAQLVRPGCPVVYGGLSSMASMVTGDPLFGIPEFWAAMVATTELGRSLGLPVRAGAALTDAHALDLQAGIESALGLATVIQAGVNFILHGAGIVSALNAISFEKLLVDDETVGMLRTLRAGIRVDDEALALDVIDRVGPGGNFLLEEHTAAHCRDALRPSFFNRRKYGAWAERGGRDAVEEAACRVGAALDAFAPPHIDTVIRRQLEEYALRYC